MKSLPTWTLFATLTIIQLFLGLIYIWSVIAEVLIHNGFTPSQVELLFACGTLGQYFGIIPGFLHDFKGPIVVAVYGIVTTVTGYVSVISILSHELCHPQADSWTSRLLPLPYSANEECLLAPPSPTTIAVLGLAMFVLTQGAAAVHYAAFPTLLRQFAPQTRGLISGTVVGSYGLSGVLLTTIFESFFRTADKPAWLVGFLAFVGILVTVLSVSICLMIRTLYIPPREEAGLVTPPNTQRLELTDEDDSTTASAEVWTTSVIRRSSRPSEPQDLERGKNGQPRLVFDRTHVPFKELVANERYLMYLVATAFMQGTCAAVVGNVSLLREANILIGPPSTATLVRFISIGNFSGRLCAGILSQVFSRRYWFLFFVAAAVTIAATQLTLYAASPVNSVVLILCLCGIAFSMGSNFAIGPVWVMQSYSEKHFASLQALVMGGVAVATFALSVMSGVSPFGKLLKSFCFLLQRLYEATALSQMRKAHHLVPASAAAHDASSAHLACFGSECFRAAQLTQATLTLTSAVLIGLLAT